MNFFDILSLLGGLAMFLYGMRLMGDSLKENSSGTLKTVMEKVTDNALKAFVLGVAITALIQSSTATIVITSGLVGAGILSLRQSLGIIIGANVGTTVTGQIIRLLDLNASGDSSFLRFFQPSTLAPIALIIGIILIMTRLFRNSKSIGNIAIGFGILFSGLLNMTSAVKALQESGMVERLFSGLGDNPLLGYLTGAGVAFVLNRYPSGFFSQRFSHFQSDLFCDCRDLSRRLRDDGYRMLHRCKPGSKTGWRCEHSV